LPLLLKGQVFVSKGVQTARALGRVMEMLLMTALLDASIACMNIDVNTGRYNQKNWNIWQD